MLSTQQSRDWWRVSWRRRRRRRTVENSGTAGQGDLSSLSLFVYVIAFTHHAAGLSRSLSLLCPATHVNTGERETETDWMRLVSVVHICWRIVRDHHQHQHHSHHHHHHHHPDHPLLTLPPQSSPTSALRPPQTAPVLIHFTNTANTMVTVSAVDWSSLHKTSFNTANEHHRYRHNINCRSLGGDTSREKEGGGVGKRLNCSRGLSLPLFCCIYLLFSFDRISSEMAAVNFSSGRRTWLTVQTLNHFCCNAVIIIKRAIYCVCVLFLPSLSQCVCVSVSVWTRPIGRRTRRSLTGNFDDGVGRTTATSTTMTNIIITITAFTTTGIHLSIDLLVVIAVLSWAELSWCWCCYLLLLRRPLPLERSISLLVLMLMPSLTIVALLSLLRRPSLRPCPFLLPLPSLDNSEEDAAF